MKGHLLFLGTGGSLGVPVIGCNCPVCTSDLPFNKRLRSSALIRFGNKSYLIDAGPDLRMQALKYKIDHLDGMFLTHSHYDHIAGLDDLRIFYYLQKERIPCLLSAETFDEIQVRYHYLLKHFEDGVRVGIHLNMQLLEDDFGSTDFAGVHVNYLSYYQAGMKVNGFRFGNLAYISDIKQYSEQVITALKGIDILILSALRPETTEMHFSLSEGIAFAQKVEAKQTYFTHVAHDLDYEKTEAQLPKGFHLSYDGLEIEFEGQLT